MHLRSRKESVSALCLAYYLYYKTILTFVNIASCYHSIYTYAKYFAKRHPKVVEDDKAVAVVLRLEEESYSDVKKTESYRGDRARRFTVTAIGTNLSVVAQEPQQAGIAQDIDIFDFANQLAPVPEDATSDEPRGPGVAGTMPPSAPPPRRPFWQRVTSNTSSDSNVSPSDERNKPHFPLPASEDPLNEDSPSMTDLKSAERASPSLFRRSIPTNLLRRASSDRVPRVRRPSGAPHSDLLRRRSSRPFSMLPRRSSRSSSSIYHTSTPTLQYPPAAAINPNRHSRVVDPVQDVGSDWPLRNSSPDVSHYVTALADTGHRSRDRLLIHEESEGEKEWENADVTVQNPEEAVPRKSTQTDRSSRKSRVFIKDDDIV